MSSSSSSSQENKEEQKQRRKLSLSKILSTQYQIQNKNLIRALLAISESSVTISNILSNYVNHVYAGTMNKSGDNQLQLDIDCDNAVFDEIKKSNVFHFAVSEETPIETFVGKTDDDDDDDDDGDDGDDQYYNIGFDPLDGSSIIDANFSVGSIFGIWPSSSSSNKKDDNNNKNGGILHQKGIDQVASAVTLYGPRTTLCIALPKKSTSLGKDVVLEVTLTNTNNDNNDNDNNGGGLIWHVSKPNIQIQSKGKIFAPGNLRASNDNDKYNNLIQHYIQERYTLRYTGGMVPDVYHIFTKSKGVFTNVSSTKAKAKLRLLYEVAPMGLIVECAGGDTTHEEYDSSVLDISIDDLDQRCGVCFGSSDEVAIFKKFMF